MSQFQIKITSAVVVDGVIKTAGTVLLMDENDAKDLLRREKAVLDYSELQAASTDEAPAEVAAVPAPASAAADTTPAADAAK